jgi:hypothetical protein
MFTENSLSAFDSQLSKREKIETQIEQTRLAFLDRQSSDQNFSSTIGY